MLAEAARILGVVSGPVVTYDQSFSAVCDEFLLAKKAKLERGEIRAETYRELESRIRPLKKAVGKLKMHELNTERMDAALSALTVSAPARMRRIRPHRFTQTRAIITRAKMTGL